jgi:hypothetical protein
MSNIVIDIAAEFTGNKAFKQAESSTDKLTKNVKKLAAAVGLSFGTAQVIAFGKASVKAALEAQAQQERLANLVKVTVGATESQIQALNDQADALQAIGVVNKENITQTQSQLATFNLQIDTIKTLTPAILDYVTAEKGAAASADQFKQMTNGLAQALNGNFASLTKVGFVLDDVTKKTIKEGTETERTAALVKVLDSTYKDFNKNLANTPTGQMQKLANAADDAKEIIGTGLLDALKSIGEDTSVESLATNMQNIAIYVADITRGIGKLTAALKNIPVLGSVNVGMIPILGTYLEVLREAGKQASVQKSADNQHLKSLQNQFTIIKKTNNVNKKLTADELKKLKAKQLQQAIDKANLALNKGSDVFDMDKIQVAAALKNQAEQLGKATDATQLLQIANDTARLNVKKAIFDLDAAIASGDEAAITKATAKLNEELKILAAVTGQKIQMAAIESILKGLTPKDLIDQKNLDEALRKIKEMLRLLAEVKPVTTTAGSLGGTGGGGTGGGGTGGGGTGGGGTGGGGTGGGGAGGGGTGGGGTGGGGTGGGGSTIPKLLTPDEINKILEGGGFVPIVPGSGGTTKGGSSSAGAYGASGFPGAAAAIAADAKAAADAAAKAAAAAAAEEINRLLESGSFVGITAGRGGSMGGSSSAGAYAASGFPGANNFNITVNTGVGDPNAIAEAISNVLREAQDRGTLTAV